jgi:hypothetical protein
MMNAAVNLQQKTALRNAFLLVLCMAAIVTGSHDRLYARETGTTQQEFLHHSVDAALLVGDAEKAAGEIVRWVETRGGYFVVKATDMVVVRIPAPAIGKLRPFLESISGRIVRYNPVATDLRRELLTVRAGIESREEILQKNLEYIDNTDVGGTLAIEQEITELQQEIEQLKGRERRLVTDRRFARAEIALAFQEQTLPDTIPSSFEWVNTVGFFTFMRGGKK